MEGKPDLATLRLFADIRQAALKLRCLDTPHAPTRQRLIRDPEVFHALTILLNAAQKLVAGPDENALFWHPRREELTEAEKRFDKLREELA